MGASVVLPGSTAEAILVKSPAPFRPSVLTLATPLAIMLSSGRFADSLNCSLVWPATATIRPDFWNVRATFSGITDISMMSDPAVANSFASDWP